MSKIFVKSFLTALLAIFLIIGYNYLKDSKHLPIRTVNVAGQLTYLHPETVQDVLDPYVAQSFFTVNVQGIRAALTEQPWLASVQVGRVWPDTLSVRLQEHVPIAYWGDRELVSDQGLLFAPETLPDLPLVQLSGPDEQVHTVLLMLQEVNQVLQRLDVRVSCLQLNERRAWQAELTNGVKIYMGSVDVMPRLQRFVASYPRDFKENADAISYVDLRYTNGFVVAND
jgi:cell division protein FtsQ